MSHTRVVLTGIFTGSVIIPVTGHVPGYNYLPDVTTLRYNQSERVLEKIAGEDEGGLAEREPWER